MPPPPATRSRCHVFPSAAHITTPSRPPPAQVFQARAYAVFFGNRQLLMGHLLQAQRLHPPLDVGFLVHQARRQAESAAGSVSTALHRIAFEKGLADARKYVLRAVEAQVGLWTELLEARPRLLDMHALASAMSIAGAGAEQAFADLLAINPQVGVRAGKRVTAQAVGRSTAACAHGCLVVCTTLAPPT